MPEFSVPIAVPKYYRIGKVLLYFMIACWFIAIVSYYEKFYFRQLVLIISLFVSCFFMGLDELLSFRKDFVEVLGTLRITEDEIIVSIGGNSEIIRFDEITSLILNVNETSRDKRIKWSFNKRKTGLGNWADITTKGLEFKTYPLYFDSSVEVENLDTFLSHVKNKKIWVKRDGVNVDSVKETHYKWYPKHIWDTSPKDCK